MVQYVYCVELLNCTNLRLAWRDSAFAEKPSAVGRETKIRVPGICWGVQSSKYLSASNPLHAAAIKAQLRAAELQIEFPQRTF